MMLPGARSAPALGPVRIVFTDLDGTLLNSRHQLSTANRRCLVRLGELAIPRVIATGRSLFSFQRAIGPDFPADYLIFSSGAGIFDLRTGSLLHAANLNGSDVACITGHLLAQKVDFMVHHEVPDNHHFVFRNHNPANQDFQRRIDIYRQFATAHDGSSDFPAPAAQVITILPQAPSRLDTIRWLLAAYQVTRTTSPLDHQSIWLEIMPRNIHKGSSAAWLCRYLGIDPDRTLGIGNDYNDLDLLDFTAESTMLANGPAELKGRYRLGPSNDDDGFSRVVATLLPAL